MIQELLGGGLIGGGERKFSPSPSSTTSTTTSTTSSTSADNQNLRCPRCDSANTKFCYYNNYNLTQPRHFCKTCRRYWTKGGALRNVPIGGGCRKNKTGGLVPPSSVGKSCPAASGKVKTGLVPLIDHHEAITSNFNPVLWAGPQNSHLLALLRTAQNPNPNPNSVSVKEEGVMVGTPMGLDNLNHVSPIGLWRNNQYQAQAQAEQQQQQQNAFTLGEVQQNTAFHELYQRLRLSSANYYTDHSPLVLSNAGSSSSASSSTILESAPITGGDQVGFWNPTFSWSDLPTTNGTAYP